MAAWGRCPENSKRLLESLSSWRESCKWRRIVVEVIFIHELVHGLYIAFINLFIEPAD